MRRFLVLFVSAALLTVVAACGSSRNSSVPASATTGYCPVCKMKVKSDDLYASEIIYSDGTKLMFETAGDMLTFYSAPDRYDVPPAQKDRANIEKIQVKDFQTRDVMDARRAVLVYKSRIKGPMGPDVFAFATETAANNFMQTNGGTVVAFDDLTPEMVQNLRKP